RRKGMIRRNPWLVVLGGVFLLAILIVGGLSAWWRYANEVPTYPPAAVVMPVPNAYDDYVAAGELCRAIGGNQLPGSAGPVGPPGRAPKIGGPPPAPPGSPAPLVYPGAPPGIPLGPPPRSGRPRFALDPDVTVAELRGVVARNRPALQRLRE